eukprot:9373036-Karenia_brevis.AAC.1
MQRAKRPGAAAEAMERKKRDKYGEGMRMVPFIVESHGRIGPAAMKWMQMAYRGQPALKRELLMEISAH